MRKKKTKVIVTNPRIYSIWKGMKRRCYDPNSTMYYRYGGRGITICWRWRFHYENFEKWALSHGYADNLTIDRIDNDKGYMPSNCQWLTASDNSKKRVLDHKDDVDLPYEERDLKGKFEWEMKNYNSMVKLRNQLIEQGGNPDDYILPPDPRDLPQYEEFKYYRRKVPKKRK